MKFLYLSAVTIFFMANALFAQESIDYEPLQRFSQEYYKSSQDKKVFEYAAGNVDLSLITLGVPPWNKISDKGIFQKPWIKKVKEEK